MTVGKDFSGIVSSRYFIKVGKELTFEAGDQIVFKVGSAMIILRKNGDVEIKGNMINVKGSGDVQLKGTKLLQGN